MKVSLPEQVFLELNPAGYGSRALSYIVDFLIRWTFILITCFLLFILWSLFSDSLLDSIYSLIPFIENWFGSSSNVFWAIIACFIFFAEWAYPVYFEVWKQGVSPGKKLFGLRVVDEHGLPLSFKSSSL